MRDRDAAERCTQPGDRRAARLRSTLDSRTRRWLVPSIVAWLLAAAAYTTLRVSFERAPAVHIRWASAVDDRARAALEQRFALTSPAFDSGRTWVYVLLSPTQENIRAIVQSPAVDDTNFIDRSLFRVSTSAPRRGPYLARTRWIPAALQTAIVIFVFLGTAAFLVAVMPAALRAVTATFSPDTAGQGVQSLVTTDTLALAAMCAALALVWRQYFRELRRGAISSAPFRVGDWLVSYDTGFVRRGLTGSPILWATQAFHIQPETIVFWIQVALYTLLSLLLFALARRRRVNVWFLAFLFSPAGLLFPLYDVAVVGRKDLLFFVLFALYAWWMPRPGRWRTNILTFVLGAATTLTHELFFFFTPYFFVMRFLDTKPSGERRFQPEWSLFAGSLIALLLVSTVGADLHGEAQCAALLHRGFHEDLCDGILRYPATTIAASVQDIAVEIRNDHYLIAYPSALLLALLPLVPFGRSLRSRPSPMFWRGVLGAFALTLPMFGIVLDWGRLLDLHVMATAIVILAFVLEDRRTPGSIFGVRLWWLRAAILVAVSVYLTTWSIRHCCVEPFRAGIFS
ncbi:MAG TPA: hypothetical protein VL173_02485 [Vicinamibacterales bacterium]|nr:hypothetical protein [Vicinamibacterales bacterium]